MAACCTQFHWIAQAARMLYLASQSPRRRELLAQLGVAFEIVTVAVPEVPQVKESPREYVSRVARDKARAGLAACKGVADVVVLGADTEVVLDDEVFGKPRDAHDAAAMLHRLSGRVHEVVSTVWLLRGRRERAATCVSQVRFTELDPATVAAYVATGESMGKAGAYAIQGRGAALIEHLDGSYSGVMGLPLFETACLLHEAHVIA
jgi:septum formation protein